MNNYINIHSIEKIHWLSTCLIFVCYNNIISLLNHYLIFYLFFNTQFTKNIINLHIHNKLDFV